MTEHEQVYKFTRHTLVSSQLVSFRDANTLPTTEKDLTYQIRPVLQFLYRKIQHLDFRIRFLGEHLLLGQHVEALDLPLRRLSVSRRGE